MRPDLQSKAKNTAFSRTTKFEFGSKKFSHLGPMVMGIINITPDSFYSKSRSLLPEECVQIAKKMIDDGASLIDIGAVSTRPGALDVSEKEELDRLLPIVKSLTQEIPNIALSIDTYRVNVAEKALENGAMIINDISGGMFDPEMVHFIGKFNIPYIMMHIFGTPESMQTNALDKNAFKNVKHFFEKQIPAFEKYGATQLVIDPGFGFGKTLAANYQILAHLNEMRMNNYPILVGISRKSMIHKLLDINAEDALNGTTALHSFALMKEANILRVHDVKAAVETVTLWKQLIEVSQSEDTVNE